MICKLIYWLRGVDLNHRPLGYEPNELPDCSTPQSYRNVTASSGQILVALLSRQSRNVTLSGKVEMSPYAPGSKMP